MGNELSKLFVAIGIQDAEFHKGLKGIEQKMRTVGANMTKIGAGITAAVGLIGGASLKMAADFDSAMREVNTMMLLNEAEFQSFSAEIREMSTTMGVDAVDSAKALYQAISAGVPRENVIEFLQVATKAAIGGVTETTTAVDGLTTVLNAFKLPISDAQKVADFMFTTIKGGKTTFEELSASLFNVAPIAAASNVEFEEVAAALAAMTQQGVPTAQATTQLRQAFVALQKPTAEMQTMLDGMGWASGQ
ncbi:MAG TPA: phage tail tape measure protein, partial [Dehalococcoidales bacterium]|nr:phage tail tape measure protein [Dehalococcoidales bacterium]